MTLQEHLALPISERIKRYENEFVYGNPDMYPGHPNEPPFMAVPADYLGYLERKNNYVLYRLRREEFERAEVFPPDKVLRHYAILLASMQLRGVMGRIDAVLDAETTLNMIEAKKKQL